MKCVAFQLLLFLCLAGCYILTIYRVFVSRLQYDPLEIRICSLSKSLLGSFSNDRAPVPLINPSEIFGQVLDVVLPNAMRFMFRPKIS